MVEAMAGLGIPEDRMTILILNPKTKRPISPVTLRKYFRLELNRGLLKADVTAGQNLLRLTAKSAAAAIFWAKVRLHMKETAELEIPFPAATALEEDQDEPDVTDLARRIAFTLVLAGRQGKPKHKPKTAIDK